MKKLLVLVHGLFRTPRDMRFLKKGLGALDYDLLAVCLPTTFGSLETCVKALDRHIHDKMASYESVSFVAHSMGGLIVRSYLAKYRPLNIGNCVFIATPHKGSRLADIATSIELVGKVFCSLYELRSDQRQSIVEINKDIALGLIIGTNNNLFWGQLFLSSKSDGRVEIASASAPDARETIELPFGHENIHHEKETLDAVIRFLESGSF